MSVTEPTNSHIKIIVLGHSGGTQVQTIDDEKIWVQGV